MKPFINLLVIDFTDSTSLNF